MSYKHNQTGGQKPPIIPFGLVTLETSSQKSADCVDSQEVKVQWVTSEWCGPCGKKLFVSRFIINELINLEGVTLS